ncbi:MAG: response regulator [Xenococcaceae cyanobacterium MO_188.B29]|nr:response regulator [Xenococcaceae cyanobacterium MO_188.B29]
MNNNISERSSNSPLNNGNSQVREFDTLKQNEIFATLKQIKFSGQLVFTEPKGSKWVFYLHSGFIMYVTGGVHPIRQWVRHLNTQFPHLFAPKSKFNWKSDLATINPQNVKISWHYELLSLWIQQQKITREQATKMIWSVIVEGLFDINQATQVSYELKQSQSVFPKSSAIVLIDGNQVVAEVERQWRTWQEARLTQHYPNQAPVIRQPEQLQQNTSPHVLQMLNQLLEGQPTLRELSIRMKRDVLTVIRSLMPYFQSGLVELVNVPDIPSPVNIDSNEKTEKERKPLIACVDDSPLVCQSMEKLLVASGYRFVGINEPLRAFGALLALKPDLIFLDLMMPNTNGYEICDKLRRIPTFRNTPIIILTGNDGVVDRVRAKIVGATDFLSKAKVDAETVLGVLHKHLRHCTLQKLAVTEHLLRQQNRTVA